MVVHTPGDELMGVTPTTREDYLYDDLPDAYQARKEHRRFTAILERFCQVYEVRDLLARCWRTARSASCWSARRWTSCPSEPLAREIEALPPAELVTMLIEGKVETPGPLARTLNEYGYELPPLPNLFFTRDSAMSVGRHVLVGSMRYGIRWPEELIMKALFLYHPLLRNEGILYDGSIERRLNYTLEGGDVHTLREDLVIIGFSERSSPGAIDHLVERAVRDDEGHGHHRRGHAEGEHGDPPRHDLHPGGPRAVRVLRAALHRRRAAQRPALAQGADARCARCPDIFAALARLRHADEAGALRR